MNKPSFSIVKRRSFGLTEYSVIIESGRRDSAVGFSSYRAKDAIQEALDNLHFIEEALTIELKNCDE